MSARARPRALMTAAIYAGHVTKRHGGAAAPGDVSEQACSLQACGSFGFVALSWLTNALIRSGYKLLH